MTRTPPPWWKSWTGLPEWAEPGRSWTISGPDGTFFIEVRRSGVEPSGGLGVGIPIWLFTRIRWQVSRRDWEVLVLTPWRRGHLTRRSRTVWKRRLDTFDGALQCGDETLQVLRSRGLGQLPDGKGVYHVL